MASSTGNRMSRDDYRKAKELEELRKTGAAPPETDEEGKMINPHIPQYVSKLPFYLQASEHVKPTLKHQKNFMGIGLAPTTSLLDAKWYQRGVKNERRNRWVKGACENCGASSHQKKDCVEKPRKVPAKFSNKNIAPDEYVPDNIALDFDGKRDRWNGYDPATYKKTIEHHQKTEAARRVAKQEEIDAKLADDLQKKAAKKEEKRLRKEAKAKAKKDKSEKQNSSESDSDSDSDTDSDVESDAEEEEDEDLKDAGVEFQKLDAATRTSVRNLRMREDTAKYLINLDRNSAYYDPKTRSMRENPHPDKDPSEVIYAGDNFVRHSGDVNTINDMQSFVWAANDKGNEDINTLANPSQAEKMFANFKERKDKLKTEKKAAVLEMYGGAEHLQAPSRQLLLGESEAYVEYSEDGRVVKGQEEAIPKTKYAALEDVLEANHTQVWGSWFDLKTQKWGFGCCHTLSRHAYCIGNKWKEIEKEQKLRHEHAMAPPPSRGTSSHVTSNGTTTEAKTNGTSHRSSTGDSAKPSRASTEKSALEGLSYASDKHSAKENGHSMDVDPSEQLALNKKRAREHRMAEKVEKNSKDKDKNKNSSSGSNSGSGSSSSGSSSSSSSDNGSESSSGSDSDSVSNKKSKRSDKKSSKKDAPSSSDLKERRSKAHADARAERRSKKKQKVDGRVETTNGTAQKKSDTTANGNGNSNGPTSGQHPSEADMEEYQRTKLLSDDPMANMKDYTDE